MVFGKGKHIVDGVWGGGVGGDCECCEGREDVWLVRTFWNSTYTYYRELGHTALQQNV